MFHCYVSLYKTFARSFLQILKLLEFNQYSKVQPLQHFFRVNRIAMALLQTGQTCPRVHRQTSKHPGVLRYFLCAQKKTISQQKTHQAVSILSIPSWEIKHIFLPVRQLLSR